MNFERCMKQKCKNCKYNNKCFKDRQNKKTKNDKHKNKEVQFDRLRQKKHKNNSILPLLVIFVVN